MRRRPPRSTRTDTLFPDTTLFRSTEVPWSVAAPPVSVAAGGLAGDVERVRTTSRSGPLAPRTIAPSPVMVDAAEAPSTRTLPVSGTAVPVASNTDQIGRAGCRERRCTYV